MDHPRLGRRISANQIYAVTVVKTDKALGEAAESLLILKLDLCGQNLPEVGETPSEYRPSPCNLSCQTGTRSLFRQNSDCPKSASEIITKDKM